MNAKRLKLFPLLLAVLMLAACGGGGDGGGGGASPSAGSLDTSFGGGDGIVTTPIGTGAFASALAVQPLDGKIVVAGSSNSNFALARYTATGALDASFGSSGVVTTAIIGTTVSAHALAIQPLDGKIVVAGSAQISGTDSSFALTRYTSNGDLDGTFGASGIVTTLIGTSAQASALALQPDGKIVVAGSAEGAPNQFALARYNP